MTPPSDVPCAEVLRGRVHDDRGAEVPRALEVGGCDRVVYDERDAGFARDRRYGVEVQHLRDRIRDRFGEDGARVRSDRRFPPCDVVLVDEGDVDSPVGERVVEQVDRAPVELARRDDVLALLHECQQRERDGRLSRRDGRRRDPAFELGDALLEHEHRRVGRATVDVPLTPEREQIARIVERRELERVGLMDGRDGGVLDDAVQVAGVDLGRGEGARREGHVVHCGSGLRFTARPCRTVAARAPRLRGRA